MINWVAKRSGICLLLASLIGCPMASAEPQLNAETSCAAPLRAFEAEIEGAVELDRQIHPLRTQMLHLLKSCQQVIEQQLTELQQDYSQLPADSQCQLGLRDLEPFVPLFTDMQVQIDQQPLATHAEKRSAIAHFRVITPGVLRTVNGVFLHRYAVCEPELEIRGQSVIR